MAESLRDVDSKHTLYSKTTRQVCNPNFGSSDIKRFYYLKVIYILELLYREDEPFIFSDVDCYFFKDFYLDLGRYYDFFIQYEKKIYGRHTVCSGFMLLKPNYFAFIDYSERQQQHLINIAEDMYGHTYTKEQLEKLK
jgi:hypothetical protein